MEQNYTKPQEALELKLTKPKKTFSLKPSPNLGLESNWSTRLTSLEV